MTALATRDLSVRSELPGEIALLKDPVLFAIGVDRSELPSTLLKAVRVFWFESADDGVASFIDEHGGRFEAREAPLCPLAVLADQSRAHRVHDLVEWLQARGSQHRPPVMEWGQGKEFDVAALLVRRTANALSATARRTVMANRELHALRRLNDDLQSRFAAVEAFVGRHGLQPFELAFSNEPVGDPSRPNVLSDASTDGISQILPVASSGVSAIGIHFEQAPRGRDAVLYTQLVTLEDMKIVDGWAVPVSDLVAGWNVLGLSRTLAGRRRTLELRLHINGGEDEPPLLSLGGLQPLEMFQVRSKASRAPLLKNSIAMQVWCGLPGVVLPSWANYLPAQSHHGEEESFREIPVTQGILELATHSNSDEVDFDFPAIMPLPDERAVGCHPPATGMTIGQLPAACPPQLMRLTASACIDNDNAMDVDFAIAIASDLGAARELLDEAREPGIGEAMSGWVHVTPGDVTPVNAFVAEQVDAWQNIYLATRMSEEGNNNYAWAKFRDLSALVSG